MKSDDQNNSRTAFTKADRENIEKTAEQTQQIYNCLFGSPDRPNDGLFHLCNLNTRFRLNMSRLLWVLIPIIISIIFTLITMNV
mgnify:CR=1 FL=1